jgi:hypothetical protein
MKLGPTRGSPMLNAAPAAATIFHEAESGHGPAVGA